MRDEQTRGARTTTTLYRPVGGKELRLIEASGCRRFPPRLPEQAIFYPVLNEEYAAQIARDWNTKHSEDGRGYVIRFHVRSLQDDHGLPTGSHA